MWVSSQAQGQSLRKLNNIVNSGWFSRVIFEDSTQNKHIEKTMIPEKYTLEMKKFP